MLTSQVCFLMKSFTSDWCLHLSAPYCDWDVVQSEPGSAKSHGSRSDLSVSLPVRNSSLVTSWCCSDVGKTHTTLLKLLCWKTVGFGGLEQMTLQDELDISCQEMLNYQDWITNLLSWMCAIAVTTFTAASEVSFWVKKKNKKTS